MVLKYLHHTTEVEDIRQELLDLGHVARNIVNVHHRLTKEPLNLFFVDLEPATNNKDIYNVTAIQNKIIHIEPPRTNKKHIPQCVRCQQYGHTRTYCNKPYACIKCGGSQNSKDCNKRRDTPAKCALCGGNHPATYKGCKHYHNIIKGNNPHRTPTESLMTIPAPALRHTTTPYSPHNIHNNPHRTPTESLMTIPAPTLCHTTTPYSPPQHPQQQQQRSYADVASNRAQPVEEPMATLKAFLEDLKGLFAQLLQQNSMIINMLTTFLSKPH